MAAESSFHILTNGRVEVKRRANGSCSCFCTGKSCVDGTAAQGTVQQHCSVFLNNSKASFQSSHAYV